MQSFWVLANKSRTDKFEQKKKLCLVTKVEVLSMLVVVGVVVVVFVIIVVIIVIIGVVIGGSLSFSPPLFLTPSPTPSHTLRYLLHSTKTSSALVFHLRLKFFQKWRRKEKKESRPLLFMFPRLSVTFPNIYKLTLLASTIALLRKKLALFLNRIKLDSLVFFSFPLLLVQLKKET